MNEMVNQIALYGNGIILVAMKYFAFMCIFEPAVKKIWMFLAYAIFLIATTQVFFEFASPWLTLITNIVAYIALTFLFTGDIGTKLIFAILIYLTGILAEGMAFLLINVIYHARYGTGVVMEDMLLLGRSVVNSLHLPLVFGLVLIFRKFVYKKARHRHFKVPSKYTATILLLLLGIILINALFMFVAVEDLQRVAIPITFSNIISAGLILLIIWIYNTILNHLEEFQKNQQKDQMLERWEVQYQTAISSQKMIADIKHNLKFYLLSLAGFLREGKIEEAEKQIKSKVGSFDSVVVTGNMSIDTMLNYYQQKADEALGIKVDAKLLIPPNLKLEASLTATILGNALENALEACSHLERKQSYIRVKMEITQHDELLVIIENPYTIEPLTDGKGNLLTTKPDSQNHGMGLLSIQEILDVKKGHIHIEYGDNIFQFMLLFYNVLPDSSPNVTNVSPYVTNAH